MDRRDSPKIGERDAAEAAGSLYLGEIEPSCVRPELFDEAQGEAESRELRSKWSPLDSEPYALGTSMYHGKCEVRQ